MDGGPGPALGPSRPVEYRTARHPLSTAVSASRPPASVPPHAEPFALRSDQGALLSLDFPLREKRARARARSSTPASRASRTRRYTPPLYPFSPISLAPSLLRFYVLVTHVTSLCSSWRDGRVVFFFSVDFLPSFLLPFFFSFSSSSSSYSSYSLLFFLSLFLSLLRQSPWVSFSFRRQSHSKRTSAGYRFLSLLLAPTSLSVGWPAFGVFNLPPSHHAPPPPQPLGFCLRWELERAIRSVSFAQFLSCCAHTAIRPSFSLLSSAGVYSRCHLIAGRFSRVRYRSATESTESAAAATVARFSTSRAPNRLFLRHLLLLSSFFLFLSRGARALLFLSVSRGHVSCCSLPILGSLPPRVERACWWFCKKGSYET